MALNFLNDASLFAVTEETEIIAFSNKKKGLQLVLLLEVVAGRQSGNLFHGPLRVCPGCL